MNYRRSLLCISMALSCAVAFSQQPKIVTLSEDDAAGNSRTRSFLMKNGRLVDVSGTPGPSPPCYTLETQKVAVLVVEFPGLQFTSEYATLSDVHDMFFSSTRTSVDSYYRDVSYGLISVTGDVYGPFLVKQPFGFDQDYMEALPAVIQAADTTVDWTSYNRIVIVSPETVQPAVSGRGDMGCEFLLTSPSKGKLSSTIAWVYLPKAQPYEQVVWIAAHELGHDLSLHHASTLDYAPLLLGFPETAGTVAEYGDYNSVMGSTMSYNGQWNIGQFGAQHKAKLGWLKKGSGYLDVESDGEFHIAPLEKISTSPVGLHIRRAPGSDRWLWLEYRQPLGYDATLSAAMKQVFTGALIHYEYPFSLPDPDYHVEDRTFLLDFTQQTPHEFKDAALPSGQTWSDPYGPLKITVGTANSTGLDISIKYEQPCAAFNPGTRDHSSSADAGSISVSAPAGCAWTATSMVDWITIAAGASGTGAGTVSYSVAANQSPAVRNGWISIARQTFTVTQAWRNMAPLVKSADPASGGSTPMETTSFQFTFSDPNGTDDLRLVRVLFNTDSTTRSACYFEYDRTTNRVRVADDSGTGWSSTFENSQCVVDPGADPADITADALILWPMVRFKPSFASAKNLYLYAEDMSGLNSNWQRMGTWAIFPGQSPAIASGGVMNGASYQPQIAAATWVTIHGTNLAASTRIWQSSDLASNRLPTALDGVSVNINGKSAYMYYVSPIQLNVLAPDDAQTGTVNVEVVTPAGKSGSVTIDKRSVSPALFLFDAGGHKYIAAVLADGTYVGPSNLFPGLSTRPVRPGDVVLLFGTGFGPTNPAQPSDILVSKPAPLASNVTITVGNVSAPVAFAGLVSSGLYQFNVTIPDVPDGEQPVVAQISGTQSPFGAYIAVQR